MNMINRSGAAPAAVAQSIQHVCRGAYGQISRRREARHEKWYSVSIARAGPTWDW